MSGSVDVLTYNEKSVNETKYLVRDTYSLTVMRVVLEDEAWYECQAGIDRARAMLTVNSNCVILSNCIKLFCSRL